MTKEQATNGTILTVGGLGAILALATQLGFIGPKEQITELRTQREADAMRISRLESDVAAVGSDISSMALAMCMGAEDEATWTVLRCSGRLGRPFDATPARRRR